MQFLFNAMANTFWQMLWKSRAEEDDLLILAYGYIAPDEALHSEAVADWLRRSDRRSIVVIVGGFGTTVEEKPKQEYGEPEQEAKHVLTSLESRAARIGILKLFATTAIASTPRRIFVFVCPQYHGKVAALAKLNGEATRESVVSAWQINEALTGSSNLTGQAALLKVELDVHIERKDSAELAKLNSVMKTLVATAVNAADESDLCAEATVDIEWELDREIQRRYGKLEDEKAEAERLRLGTPQGEEEE